MTVGTRNCPRCENRPLTELEAEPGLAVDHCPDCQGLWCDAGELEELVAEPLDPSVLPLPFHSGKAQGPPCPECAEGRLTVRSTRSENPVQIFDCPLCRGIWLDGGVLPRLRQQLRARRLEMRANEPALPPPRTRPAASTAAGERALFEVQGSGALFVPLAFLFGLFLGQPRFYSIFGFWVEMYLHEFGHTVAAWFAGIAAVPVLIVAQTWTGSERAFGVVFLLAALLALLAWMGLRERRPAPVVAACLGLLLQIWLSFVLSLDMANMWIVWAGLGGELVLSTLLVVAFYYRMPTVLRWDFWRYLVVIPATTVLISNTAMWFRARPRVEDLPMGAAVGPSHNGDLNRMISDWGWTPHSILDSYRGLAVLCIVIVLAHYLLFSSRALLRRWRDPRDIGTAESPRRA